LQQAIGIIEVSRVLTSPPSNNFLERARNLSQNGGERRSRCVDASREAVVEMNSDPGPLDIEKIFQDQYERVARVIARILRDPARAEELAVEVFLKWSRNPKAQGENSQGWLYRVAVRTGLDELRRQTRRARREGPTELNRTAPPTPEDIRASKEHRQKVHSVLAAIHSRQAELLILRNQGLSYDELATALDLRPTSVGTFLSRAEQAFRKEYLKRYGQE
jgi:RNA polymerase sigma-70 factor (ECF subfamily)